MNILLPFLILVLAFVDSAKPPPDDPFDLYDAIDYIVEEIDSDKNSNNTTVIETKVNLMVSSPVLAATSNARRRFTSRKEPYSLRGRHLRNTRDKIALRKNPPQHISHQLAAQIAKAASIANEPTVVKIPVARGFYDPVQSKKVTVQASAPQAKSLVKSRGASVREKIIRQEKELLAAQIAKLSQLREQENKRFNKLREEALARLHTQNSQQQQLRRRSNLFPQPQSTPYSPILLPNPIYQISPQNKPIQIKKRWVKLSNVRLRPSMYRYQNNTSIFVKALPTSTSSPQNNGFLNDGDLKFQIDLGPFVDALIEKYMT